MLLLCYAARLIYITEDNTDDNGKIQNSTPAVSNDYTIRKNSTIINNMPYVINNNSENPTSNQWSILLYFLLIYAIIADSI